MSPHTGVESLEAKLLKFETYVIAQLLSFGLAHDAHAVAQEILCGAWITMAAVRLRAEPAVHLFDVLCVWARATCKWQTAALLGPVLAETTPRRVLLSLLALPAEFREPLTLMATGMPPTEIASRLRIETDEVDRRLATGREVLLEALEIHGGIEIQSGGAS